MREALVGLDVGTTSLKAVAVEPSGTVVKVVSRPYSLSLPESGWAEQHPQQWWRAASLALEDLEVKPLAIGLTGQMHGLVCLDRRSRVLRPAMLWNDQRAASECHELESVVGAARLIELTGNRALPGFTLPKLLWLRKHQPELYRRISKICLPKDYVRLKLTGEIVTDVNDASGTLLFDVARRRWSDEVLEALQLDGQVLPRVAESPSVCGFTEGGAVVAAGAGDQAAAAVGVGAVVPGCLSVVLGTSGVVFSTLPGYLSDPGGRLHVFCHATPDTWHAMGVMLSAAASLQWLRKSLRCPYDKLLAEAERWPPGSRGLMFAPYLMGERTPYADPDIRGAFCGLDAQHDRGALCRAVLEGVAFALKDSLELLCSVGIKPVVARLSGGGASSSLWVKILAAVLDLPVEHTSVVENAAYGAALLGGVAAGVFGSVEQAVKECVRVVKYVEPDEEWATCYRDLHLRFRQLYPALASLRRR